MIVVWSLAPRTIVLDIESDDCELAILGIPLGSHDDEVLAWAREVLEPEAVAKLREIIEREAGDSP